MFNCLLEGLQKATVAPLRSGTIISLMAEPRRREREPSGSANRVLCERCFQPSSPFYSMCLCVDAFGFLFHHYSQVSISGISASGSGFNMRRLCRMKQAELNQCESFQSFSQRQMVARVKGWWDAIPSNMFALLSKDKGEVTTERNGAVFQQPLQARGSMSSWNMLS